MFPTGNGPGPSSNISNQPLLLPLNAMQNQVPTDCYTTPMEQQATPYINNSSYEKNNNQNYYRTTSTSEEEDDSKSTSKNGWQVIRSLKRKKVYRPRQNTTEGSIESNNRYALLRDNTEEDPKETNSRTEKNNRPPPIFVHGVINYEKMVDTIREIAEDEKYVTKSLADNVIKINCATPETYRKMVRNFKENNVFHHTYQIKEERAYRVVIKHLHHSTNTDIIKEELLKLGHKTRNIINAQHRITKEPLNLFFIDLEPAKNNKEIYNIRGLQNMIVQIEPPRVMKNNIIQCMRCQQYGHSRTYCNKPYVCVKCGGAHNTKDCKKSKETPAKCALCGGSHPANYKGCEHYNKLIRGNNIARNNTQHTSTAPINTNTYQSNIQHPATPHQETRSYADMAKGKTNQSDDPATLLTKFLEEFKGLFNQLLQQNSMVLNMLTMLMNKLS